MNQTFSMTRFGRLLRKYFTDYRGQLLANIALLTGILFVATVFFYQAPPGSVSESRVVLLFVLLWPCWYVFTVQQTAVVNQKERAMDYLMQPASQFEKIALIWLISGLGFLLIYVPLFALFDSIGTWFVNNRDWTPDELAMMSRQGSLLKIYSLFTMNNLSRIPVQFWVFTALLHSFTIAFSLLIRRYTLPLVAVIAFTLIMFGLLGNNALLQVLIGSDWISSKGPFTEAMAQSPLNQNDYRRIELRQPLTNQLRYAVGITAIILLYITAYVRLKEREV